MWKVYFWGFEIKDGVRDGVGIFSGFYVDFNVYFFVGFC